MGVKIVTDSTSYINQDIIDKYGINVISLNVIFGNDSIREMDISNEDFYNRIEKENIIPTSSQPATSEFLNTFTNIVKQGHKVLAVFITSKMSGTYQAAHLAKSMVMEDYPDAEIEILESNSTGMELGYIAIEAAKKAIEGIKFEEVISHAKEIINKTKFLFAPANLVYLQKGGRIGKANALLGNVLKITPILTVLNGQVVVANKVRTTKKAIASIVDTFKNDIDQYGFGSAMVHHINCEKEAEKIAEILRIKTGKDISIGAIGPVVGVHVGPGTIGMTYFTKEDLR